MFVCLPRSRYVCHVEKAQVACTELHVAHNHAGGQISWFKPSSGTSLLLLCSCEIYPEKDH